MGGVSPPAATSPAHYRVGGIHPRVLTPTCLTTTSFLYRVGAGLGGMSLATGPSLSVMKREHLGGGRSKVTDNNNGDVGAWGTVRVV